MKWSYWKQNILADFYGQRETLCDKFIMSVVILVGKNTNVKYLS